MTTTATLQLTFAALCWSNNIVAQKFSAAMPRTHLSVLQRECTKLISIDCMWCVKRIFLGGSCSGGTEV